MKVLARPQTSFAPQVSRLVNMKPVAPGRQFPKHGREAQSPLFVCSDDVALNRSISKHGNSSGHSYEDPRFNSRAAAAAIAAICEEEPVTSSASASASALASAYIRS